MITSTRIRSHATSRAFLIGIVVSLLSACVDRTGLDPVPEFDRIVIGELKYVPTYGEIVDPAVIFRARALTNELRAGAWSSLQVVHSSCGSVLLEFYSGTKRIGYLALDANSFYTHGPTGEHSQVAKPEKAAAFLALLPEPHKRRKCEQS